MFTDNVKAVQQEFGSREQQQKFSERAPANDELTDREAHFIAARDTFYLATVNEVGWPYVQHRGGPTGFLRVLGPRQLAYADFRGNTQLVSMGNVRNNDRASLILMDYPNRKRLKILGHLRYEDVRNCPPGHLAAVELGGYKARIERLVYLDVVAFDWNCPQHITPRFTKNEIEAMLNETA